MNRLRKNSKEITSFQLVRGRVLAGKYEILSPLGSGWEGEVYKLREVETGQPLQSEVKVAGRELGECRGGAKVDAVACLACLQFAEH